LLLACGGSSALAAAPTPAPTALVCDDTMKTAFKPDANTTVTLVKAFKKGDLLALSGAPATPPPPTAANDVCLVKLMVGPGNPGPAGAPSTSAGIGIEIWLPAPANWNKRMHVLGQGGWSGNPGISSTTVISNAINGGYSAMAFAIDGGAVSAVNDGGFANAAAVGTPSRGGSFAMSPDGTINTTLWTDLATRSTHEMAVKTKALTAAYYLESPKYSYFEGCSGGGRQGYMEAQVHPADFDGIVVGAPSINQTQCFPAILYPQVVMQRDLDGVPLTADQLALASSAAVSACDTALHGQHDGYISDPAQCRYDPTTDPAVLCVANGGTNTTANCLTLAQAQAFNKMWYGPTADGTTPAPSVDNGYHVARSPGQLWFGPTRGTTLVPVAKSTDRVPAPSPNAADQVALNLQQPSFATPSFINATGNGADGWKALTYASFAHALSQGAVLNSAFGNIDTNNPDLSAFRDRGGKMLTYHGLSDPLVAPQSSIDYYTRTAHLLGGDAATQQFHRLFLVPGMGHCTGIGSVNGITGVSPQANPPLLTAGQMYNALVDWVENGNAPTTLTVTTADNSISRPLCMYPKKLTYVSSDVNAAASYTCK
jgi:feruloyl esterase